MESTEPTKAEDGAVSTPTSSSKSLFARMKVSDWFAFVALLLSLFAIGTEVRRNQIGPEVEMIAPSNRVVELRCEARVSTCLGSEDGNSEPRGRMSVILPFYFINTGAIGQNEVVSRLWIDVGVSGPNIPEDLSELFPVTLYVIADYKRTQSGSTGPATPFSPILVQGRNAAGAEYRAIDFDRSHRVPWHRIATEISEGNISGLSITLHARTELEGGEIRDVCNFTFSDSQREILSRRLNERGSQYISTVCDGA